MAKRPNHLEKNNYKNNIKIDINTYISKNNKINYINSEYFTIKNTPKKNNFNNNKVHTISSNFSQSKYQIYENNYNNNIINYNKNNNNNINNGEKYTYINFPSFKDDDYEFIEHIGEGSFGSIDLVEDKKTRKKYVIKN